MGIIELLAQTAESLLIVVMLCMVIISFVIRGLLFIAQKTVMYLAHTCWKQIRNTGSLFCKWFKQDAY
jgi:hypothetical protein